MGTLERPGGRKVSGEGDSQSIGHSIEARKENWCN